MRALRLEPGDHSPEEIMASVPEALYVQSVSGLHSGTNPISGDFSVGAEGLMVRGGEFAEPVREVTIASTLQRMLLDIADIGSDLTFLPGAVAGMTVLLSDMTRQRVVTPAAFEDRVELGDRAHGSSPKCTASMPKSRAAVDVVGVVVDEHGFARFDRPCVST